MKKYTFIDEFETGLIVKNEETVSLVLDGKRLKSSVLYWGMLG